MLLIRLFLAFLSIGMVSFGGGYAMLPLFERMVVKEQAWIDMGTFIDMIAISQITPGPIAINAATFIGYQVGHTEGLGILSSAVATTGVVFVPVVLVLIVARFFDQFKRSRFVRGIFVGLRPALAGLIMASVYSVAQSSIGKWYDVLIIAFLLVLLRFTRLHPILVIAIGGTIGMIVYL